MATKRKKISKKLRFEIFKRDGFRCQYCGKCPPATVLEIDHIDPVANGGDNDPNNLLTSCIECNRGKGANSLESIPSSLVENIDILKCKKEQYREYRKYVEELKNIRRSEISEISKIYQDSIKGYVLSESFKESSLNTFLDKLPFHMVEEAMLKACRMGFDHDRTARYFCGICWRMTEQ